MKDKPLTRKKRKTGRQPLHRGNPASAEWPIPWEMGEVLKFNAKGQRRAPICIHPTGYQINRVLAHLSYQVRQGKLWVPTEKAQGLNKRFGRNGPLMWHRDVLSILRCAIEEGDVPASFKSWIEKIVAAA